MKIMTLFLCLLITDYIRNMEIEKEQAYDMETFGFHVYAEIVPSESTQKNSPLPCLYCKEDFSCYKTITHTLRAYVTHQYEKHPNECEHISVYQNLKKYAELHHTEYNGQYTIQCPDPTCSKIIGATSYNELRTALFQHRFVTKIHNAIEIEKIKKYINDQSKK